MPPAKPAQRSTTGAPGVKVLITAASVAATLGGWALLSATEVQPAPQPAAPQAQTSALSITLAPLPTLVPPAPQSPQAQWVTVNNPKAQSAPARSAAPAPLVLREVSAPAPQKSAPSPVTNTRSSR